MYILGYSGFDNIEKFRDGFFPEYRHLQKMIVQGMDSAACLIKNGNVVAAAEEERFINVKHTSNFPKNAIEYCLKEEGISINEIDAICHGYDYKKYEAIYDRDQYNKALYQNILSPQAQINIIKSSFPTWKRTDTFNPIEHHYAHAGSTYFLSGQEESLIMVADALGEINSISIFVGKNGKIQEIATYDLLSSIGMFYSLVTAYLGFKPNEDEYKIMGLAPYGNPDKYKEIFSSLVLLESEGEIVIPKLLGDGTLADKINYLSFTNHLESLFGPSREPNSDIMQFHKDIAACLQQCLNDSIIHCLKYWQEETKLRNLCLAGGVALNCVTNSKIASTKLFDNIYIQPAAGDAGTSLGAALYYYYSTEPTPSKIYHPASAAPLPFYGPDCNYFSPEILTADLLKLLHITQLDWEELLKKVASAIADNKVIAWMNGRMEFGPRALGNRSILANPMNPNMRDIINSIVKKRESFRPFAPSVKVEAANKYFELHKGCDYSTMLMTCFVQTPYREKFPSITHIDGSARIQTVDKDIHPKYWELINQFELYTGFPIVLNTSFNIKNQAIVCDPIQGIETLINTEIDALVINNYIITKRSLITKELM